MTKIKPKMLRSGSRVAATSLSWGGPGTSPYRYQIGKQQFEEEFGVTVIETEHALRDTDWLAKNPKARAEDMMAAFADETIDGIISTIGGDDSIRTLPYLDLDLIRNNPKVFMGFFRYDYIPRKLVLKRVSYRSTVPRLWQDLPKTVGCIHTWWIPFDALSFLPNLLVLLNRTEQNGRLNIYRGRILRTNQFVENWTPVRVGDFIRGRVSLRDNFLEAALMFWTGFAGQTIFPMLVIFKVPYSS